MSRRWLPWWETRSGDWGTSRLQIHDIARAIERGELPPRTLSGSVFDRDHRKT